MLDEEQERELEQELEEETHVERPAPAEPQEAKVSDGLATLVRYCSSRRHSTRQFLSFSTLVEWGLLRLHQIFDKTSLSQVADQLRSIESVLVTEDFVSSVEGTTNLDYYVKEVRWILQVQLDSGEVFVLVSNFEAEFYADLLERQGANPTSNTRLFAFAPRSCLQQQECFLSRSSLQPSMVHTAIEVLAGSIHADGELFARIQSFLGLRLRPTIPSQILEVDEWDRLFSAQVI